MKPRNYKYQIKQIKENVCKDIRDLLEEKDNKITYITKCNSYQPFHFYKKGELYEYEIIAIYNCSDKFNMEVINGFNQRKTMNENDIEDVSDVINLYDAILEQEVIDKL